MNNPRHTSGATLPGSGLRFDEITPVAPEGLGGLIRDHFSNGRLYATVGWHGGLVSLSYWGNQHSSAAGFFQTGLETAWCKLFRSCVGLGEKRYYLPWKNTQLYPFGMRGQSRVLGMDFTQEMLLLPDALVQRVGVLRNPKKLPVFVEMFHQEKVCRVNQDHRKWSDFQFNPKLNAMIATCQDKNPQVYTGEGDSLSQQNLGIVVKDGPNATTWIGVGCDTPLKVRISHNGFKLYLTSRPIRGQEVSLFVVFATSQEKLEARLKELSKTVNQECQDLVAGYEKRLQTRPRIDVGNAVLNSAFGQYPEVVEVMKVADRPGAVRATQSGYWVWGWDGMTPLVPCPLANEPQYAAEVLRFFHNSWNPVIGLPLSFTSTFQARIKEPFPAQAQYIAGLYHYVAATGDLTVAKEVMPTCKKILERCRKDIVRDTGLVAGNALWPDFPEAMDEDGHDVSALNNSLLYQGLRSVEYLAGALGDAKLALECCQWAQKLRVSFVKYLYDEAKGFFITSCSSKTLKPRKHYGCQTVFWVTPFARELVSHAPGRIASFMHKELRSARCLLSLPQWDTAWMADGNQLGSSYPTSDYFYVNVHKLLGEDRALKTWMGDVEWFWRYHTVPEAFTPETENEDLYGPDNHGGKQCQAVTAWYACLYQGLAGLDLDHEGLTLTPWGDTPVEILGLRLHGVAIDLRIRGQGRHVGSLKLNGKALGAGARKISWKDLKGKKVRLDLVRTDKAPNHPVIVRADGLRVTALATKPGHLTALISGTMTGEVVVQTPAAARVIVDGQPLPCVREPATGTVTVPYANTRPMLLEISV